MEVNGQLYAPAALAPREHLPVHIGWIGGWAGHRASLDMVAKRRSPLTATASNGNSVVQPVALLTLVNIKVKGKVVLVFN
jgi:hypothetical protein